jgi:hypothetical protein
MNLTFPIILLLAGILFLLIGLIGRVRIRAVGDVGTESRAARVIILLVGIGLLAGAYLIYQSEKPTTTNGNVKANTQQSSSPIPSPEIVIINPTPGDEPLRVKTDRGTAMIPVSGAVKGFPESANTAVYVFTSTGNFSEWWYNEPAKPNQDGNWNTEALAGSSEKPAEPNQTVKIRAVFATFDEIQKAKKEPNKKMVPDVSSFKATNRSKEITITIDPKN